ncbi:hypothetical protein P154DRAFT_569612 [Amniculicola lignicola CBS 123094]|uniref:Uncharacterized protein n=1 Tax=Amniculicola lignicola CBS 123094 TaxID=1392246 RepID=A0A6A5WZG4_9PLEO|nr:hypothetical protein P154DRAFT_569612 [Amniculicola lignicola CBS 123094]
MPNRGPVATCTSGENAPQPRGFLVIAGLAIVPRCVTISVAASGQQGQGSVALTLVCALTTHPWTALMGPLGLLAGYSDAPNQFEMSPTPMECPTTLSYEPLSPSCERSRPTVTNARDGVGRSHLQLSPVRNATRVACFLKPAAAAPITVQYGNPDLTKVVRGSGIKACTTHLSSFTAQMRATRFRRPYLQDDMRIRTHIRRRARLIDQPCATSGSSWLDQKPSPRGMFAKGPRSGLSRKPMTSAMWPDDGAAACPSTVACSRRFLRTSTGEGGTAVASQQVDNRSPH